jgi:hypothetical protein
MKASTIRALLATLVMPLCGFSCIAFRDFQVRPYLSEEAQAPLTISILVEDYRKVSDAVKTWAAEAGLKEEPCRYYGKVAGLSPACQVFRGDMYIVLTDFTPGRNSTRVSVQSSTHKIADDVAQKVRKYLAMRLGERSIGEYGGGEMPNKGVEPTR